MVHQSTRSNRQDADACVMSVFPFRGILCHVYQFGAALLYNSRQCKLFTDQKESCVYKLLGNKVMS